MACRQHGDGTLRRAPNITGLPCRRWTAVSLRAGPPPVIWFACSTLTQNMQLRSDTWPSFRT